jgi:hypothetical protein
MSNFRVLEEDEIIAKHVALIFFFAKIVLHYS